VATSIKESYRGEDILARFGGEEFVVLLGECELLSAQVRAESLCQKIEALKPSGGVVTISIGGAQLSSSGDEDFTRLLKRADLAVYRAKEQGRNRVVGSK